jgi:hypothetical protein
MSQQAVILLYEQTAYPEHPTNLGTQQTKEGIWASDSPRRRHRERPRGPPASPSLRCKGATQVRAKNSWVRQSLVFAPVRPAEIGWGWAFCLLFRAEAGDEARAQYGGERLLWVRRISPARLRGGKRQLGCGDEHPASWSEWHPATSV